MPDISGLHLDLKISSTEEPLKHLTKGLEVTYSTLIVQNEAVMMIWSIKKHIKQHMLN